MPAKSCVIVTQLDAASGCIHWKVDKRQKVNVLFAAILIINFTSL